MNDMTAGEWLTSPAVTAKLAEFKADSKRLWRIVDRTFEKPDQCEARSCQFLDAQFRRSGMSYACELRNKGGDVMDCAGVQDSLRAEVEDE
jgi:hypothetical protein